MNYLLLVLAMVMAEGPYMQPGIFEKIQRKTWFETKGFAGTTIVFYTTRNGLPKAIRQVNGSGVPVVRSEIYDVAISANKVLLSNGLDLENRQALSDKRYVFEEKNEQLLGAGVPLVHFAQRPVLFSWTATTKKKHLQVDVERLTAIPLNRHDIYAGRDIDHITLPNQ